MESVCYEVQLILTGLEFLWGCGNRGCSMLWRKKKILPLEPGDMAWWLRSLAALLPGFNSQHPEMAHGCLYLQFQAIWSLFLNSSDNKHKVVQYIHAGKKTYRHK